MNFEYWNNNEVKIAKDFIKNGYIIVPVDKKKLNILQKTISLFAGNKNQDPTSFLNNFKVKKTKNDLNKIRISIIKKINNEKKFRKIFFEIARKPLEILIGNEICMQKNLNLSIQLPNDNSSLLPLHADVLNGDSPFEVVQWLPFVDCYKTKTMYLLPANKSKNYLKLIKKNQYKGTDAIYKKIKKNLIWLNVPYGKCVIFNQNLFHGNIVNKEEETRWTINCRYKSLFSPYKDKKFDEFFEPIIIRPATKIGLEFKFPTI